MTRDDFSLKAWQLFDKLVRSECPDVPPEVRYDLMLAWDDELVRLMSKIDVLHKLGY